MLDPEWNETFIQEISCDESFPILLSLEISKKSMGKTQFMGKLDIPLEPLLENDCNEAFTLQKRTTEDVVEGEIILGLNYASETKPRKIQIKQTQTIEQNKEDEKNKIQEESYPYKFGIPESDDNIAYEDKDKKIISGGDIYKIIDRMTDASTDLDFIDSIILTLHSFSTPVNFMKLLIQRYSGKKKNKKKNHVQK